MKSSSVIIVLITVAILCLVLLYQLRNKEKETFFSNNGKFIGFSSTLLPEKELKSDKNTAITLIAKESVMPDPTFYINPYDGNIADKSMNKYKTKFEGNAKLEDGKINLHGKNSFVSTNFKPNLDHNTEYTFSLWFKDERPGVYHYKDDRNFITTALISNYGANHTVEYSGLHIDGLGKINVSERNHNKKVESVTTKKGFCDGKWHHIAKVATSEEQIIYVDGVKVESAPRVGGRVTSPSNNIVIGGSRNNRYQTAELGPIQIFAERALTERQLLYIYKTQSKRMPIKRSTPKDIYLKE